MKTNEIDNLTEILNEMFKDSDMDVKCDVIDIADEEMKSLNIQEMDKKYQDALISQATKTLLELVNSETCTNKDTESYKNLLEEKDILDIRVSEKSLYIKTNKNIIPIILSNILKIEEEYIEKVPINGKYNFYLINAQKWDSQQKVQKVSYNPEKLIEVLKKLGETNIDDETDKALESIIDGLIFTGFAENFPELIDTYFRCNVENKVLAIGINTYIPEAKHKIGTVLGINPKLFTEVIGPQSTVLLFDARRWFLEDCFGEVKWYL